MTARDDLVQELYRCAPPFMRDIVFKLLSFESELDWMGYDMAYLKEDLPKVVLNALKLYPGTQD